MDKSPMPFLSHIKEAISLIEEYVLGLIFEQFKKDRKTQDAVIRQLEVIGEASTNLENKLKTTHPEIPWREIVDFRNVLIHDYWEIDMDIVWKAATEDVKKLKNGLNSIVYQV